MSNAAPGQISQIGEAVSRAGSAAFQTGQTMGDKIQDTIDDANVRAAETGFLQNAQGIVTDYTHQLGKNAMDAYDPATQALSKAKQDAAAGLTNPIQQKMFNYVSSQHLMMFGRQMGDHNFQQTVNYRVKEGNDSADAQGQLAAQNYSDWQRPDGNYNQYKTNTINEITAAAHLSGIGPGAQLTAAIQQKTSGIADSVLLQMTGQEHYDEAKTFYEAALANHELDKQMQDKWGPAIEQGHKSEKGKNLGDKWVQIAMGASPDQQRTQPIPGGAITAVPTVGEPGRQEPVQGPITGVMGDPRAGHEHHGIDTAVPVGTPVKAPADGTVSRVWDDGKAGGGLSMEVTYPSGYKEYFMHLSAQNYQQGQKVTQGGVLGLSGQSGNATGPVLHDAMKDPKGQWVDPRNVSPAPKDPLQFTNPNWLETALQGVRQDPDSDDREKAIAEAQVLKQYNIAKDVATQKYTQVRNTAVDWKYAHGSLNGLDANVMASLKPEDRFNLSKPIEADTDPGTMAGFILNPETLTVDNVKAAYTGGKLSNGSYLSLLTDATKLANKPDKVLAATVEADRIKFFADQAGIPQFSTQTDDQKREYNQLLVRIQSDVNTAQINKGGELTQAEKDAITQRNLQQYSISHLRSAWSPLAWLGNTTYTDKAYGFQMPPGATGTVTNKKDGKLHYTDGKNDLGAVPEP
jgi:murein DD-endopeptidase MepM/ murein hydrolase activator NlpD